MTAQHFDVHDILETPGHVSPRLYVIEGIHFGALSQEDVIELKSIDRTTPDAHGKHQRMFVPKEMIEAGISSGIFNITSPE